MHVGTLHLNGVQWGDCIQYYTLLYDIIYHINYYIIHLITLIYILYLLACTLTSINTFPPHCVYSVRGHRVRCSTQF